VFDGTRPFEKTDAPTAPRGLYGAVHADFDNARGDLGNSLGIVRLTKVVTTESSTFRAWRAAAAARSTIVAPPDLRMAPVTLPFAASLIARCGIEKRVGLYHCSGERDIEYFAAASAFAERVGLPASNVLSKSVDALGIDPAVVTEYSSLDMSETISAYGVRGQSFADVADFIARA
ncbi:MAG: sugar nucleotide-binding protein, partial [Rhodospirillales bacterium]